MNNLTFIKAFFLIFSIMIFGSLYSCLNGSVSKGEQIKLETIKVYKLLIEEIKSTYRETSGRISTGFLIIVDSEKSDNNQLLNIYKKIEELGFLLKDRKNNLSLYCKNGRGFIIKKADQITIDYRDSMPYCLDFK